MIRAGFWIRVAAALIDAVLMLALGLGVFYGVAFAMGGFAADVTQEHVTFVERVGETFMLGAVLLYTMLEIWKSATPGKMLLKLQILSADGTLAPSGNLFNRWSIKQSPQILGFFAVLIALPLLEAFSWVSSMAVLVSCLMVLRTTRRAWHDDMAGTAVFRPGPEEQHGFEPILTAAYAPLPAPGSPPAAAQPQDPPPAPPR